MHEYDAIILGGGANGLATAAELTRHGMRVGVVERRYDSHGALTTQEVYSPGVPT